MPAAPRSTFVTVIAWILIVLCGMSTLVGALQNLMLTVMFSSESFSLPMRDLERLPWLVRTTFEHMRLLFLLFLLASASGLAVGIGLLKRLEWARLGVIALMLLCIAWNLFGLAMQFSMLLSGEFAPRPGSDPSGNFGVIRFAFLAFATVFVLTVCGGFAWLIRKFLSPGVRAEFVGAH